MRCRSERFPYKRNLTTLFFAANLASCQGTVDYETESAEGRRGRCEVTPNPAQPMEEFTVTARHLRRYRQVVVVLSDGDGTRDIGPLETDYMGRVSTTGSTNSPGAGTAGIYRFRRGRKTHLLAQCTYDVGDAGCSPNTCTAEGAECGTVTESVCGTLLNCGGCASGFSCQDNHCVEDICSPNTCTIEGAECGTVTESVCGTLLNCGGCASGFSCQDNQCIPDSGDCDRYVGTAAELSSALSGSPGNETICATAGTYGISQEIHVKAADVTLKAAPNAIFVRSGTVDNGDGIITVDSNAVRFKLIGGRFQGPANGYIGHALQVHANHSLVRDAYFIDIRAEGRGYGVVVDGADDMIVENNWFERNRHGVAVGGNSGVERLTVRRNTVVDSSDAALDTHSGSSQTVWDSNFICFGDIETGFLWPSFSGANPGNYNEQEGIMIQGNSANIINNDIFMQGWGRHPIEFQCLSTSCTGSIQGNHIYNVTQNREQSETEAIIVSAYRLASGAIVDIEIATGNVLFRDERAIVARPGVGATLPAPSTVGGFTGSRLAGTSQLTCGPISVDMAQVPQRYMTRYRKPGASQYDPVTYHNLSMDRPTPQSEVIPTDRFTNP